MNKLVVLILMGMFLITGCQSQKEIELPKKNVKVIQAETKKYPLTLEYAGIVDSQDVRTMAFKTGGKIEGIYVKSGQQVNKGYPLIKISEADLKDSAEVAKAQYEIAKTQYDKAVNGATQEDINQIKINLEMVERNYISTKELYEKYEELLKTGATSTQQLQDIKLKLDLEEKQLDSAREAYNKILNGARKEDIEILKNQMDIAFVSYQQSQDLLENSMLKSEIDGTVLQILVKEGDYIAKEAPVIVIKGKESTIKVGVTNEDVRKIELGTDVIVKYPNDEIKGSVENVSSIPGDQSSLYEVKINLEPNSVPIGTLVDASFMLGEVQGLFVPLNSLLNESFDFVYIVQDEKAVMKEVVLGEVFGNEIEIKDGINPGDKVIVEGVKSVKNGDWVEIKE